MPTLWNAPKNRVEEAGAEEEADSELNSLAKRSGEKRELKEVLESRNEKQLVLPDRYRKTSKKRKTNWFKVALEGREGSRRSRSKLTMCVRCGCVFKHVCTALDIRLSPTLTK